MHGSNVHYLSATRPSGPPSGQDKQSLHDEVCASSASVAKMLEQLSTKLSPVRRVVHAGEAVFQSGERFTHLYIVNSGVFKIVNFSPDGREQVAALKFRGDWLGFDAIAQGRHRCDAIALDPCEVWLTRYEVLLQAITGDAELMNQFHRAMSREIANERDALLSICTLPADARVADFLRFWVASQARSGLRVDCISLYASRAEIANHLGLTVETVSRALSKLQRSGLISISERGRREIAISDIDALTAYVHRCGVSVLALEH